MKTPKVHIENVLWNYELVKPEATRAEPDSLLLSLLKDFTILQARQFKYFVIT